MKKLIIIMVFVFSYIFSWGQQFIKTTTPCNDELLKKTPGRWIRAGEGFHAIISKQQQQEISNRLDVIHQLTFKIYPSPVAFDAAWSLFTSDEVFASQLKIDHTASGISNAPVYGIPTVYYSYFVHFNPYSCGREPHEMRRGYPGEDGSYMGVYINRLEHLFTNSITDRTLMEPMRIDGRPIKMMPVIQEKWKGYDIYAPEPGSSEKIVLLHREGMLPYIPVTRKQYLDKCIEYLPQFFDPMMKPSPFITDKKEQEEQIKKVQKVKDDVLKHYQDELRSATSAGLLDSPAVIQVPIFNMSITAPIFTTQASGGIMLVTENPAYLRKDLPKYIPQFMVFKWWPCHCGVTTPADPYKAINENFPIEKLQAMIDK